MLRLPAMPALPRDPRPFQIAVLGGLLVYGTLIVPLGIHLSYVPLIIGTALATQWCGVRLVGLGRFDPLSPLISSLSLCLLLRTNEPLLAVLAAAVAIGSKFVLRAGDRHIFNPTNFALVVMLLLGGGAWVSPGQWGSQALGGFVLAMLGVFVINRASRSDVTFAFLAAYAAILFGRAAWLGDPLTIPWHTMQNGALLLFAFFMISDPKTTPSSRAGRIVFACLVALGAAFVQFGLFRQNGLLWSLVAACSLVPILDRLLPGTTYTWPTAAAPRRSRLPRKDPSMLQPIRASLERALFLLVTVTLLVHPSIASAFCGFYVAKADASLFNQASRVVVVRDGDRTVITMANDFQGDPTEFAVVIPVPTPIERGQVNVASMAPIDHLDAFTAPRLVEYFDGDPCQRLVLREMAAPTAGAMKSAVEEDALEYRVVIEASFTVGEYDILILSAEESDGLERWLVRNGYKIPDGASRVLGSYIKQNMKFFVAKVNLEEQAALGFQYLRPIQIAYESPKFMLPIRLGTVNAKGTQDLLVYALTRTGRVETTNYRTVKLPTGVNIPAFVKDEFADFYRDMFTEQVKRHDMRAVFLEYAWDMAWCDPCAADPLSRDQLRELGVFWLDDTQPNRGQAQNAFVTRLHVRYDGEHFPEDLVFQETGDRSNFQGRYVIQNPWTGKASCEAAHAYRQQLEDRQRQEAKALANLTGWDLASIHERMQLAAETKPVKWWDRLWGNR